MVLGYLTEGDASRQSMNAYHSYLNVVSADLYVVTSNGEVTGDIAPELLARSQQEGIRVFACVSNSDVANGFDPKLGHVAIVTERAKVIGQLVALARSHAFYGVNLDFEQIEPGDRDALSSFVADLADALHAEGSHLALSVPAKTEDDPGNTYSWPFDYRSLGKSADFIFLMTYDQHYSDGSPGSVAGLDWMEKCVAYATSVIDAEKLLIGLPAYGYDWNRTAVSKASAVSWKDVPALLARTGAVPEWDPVTQSAHVAYRDRRGHEHEVWFENAQGIERKARLVKDYDLAGLSVWSLAQEDASFWSAVSAGLR